MFVRIGHKAFNPDLVTDIQFEQDQITLFFPAYSTEADSIIYFENTDKDNFMHWWDNIAEKIEISVHNAEEPSQEFPKCGFCGGHHDPALNDPSVCSPF